MWKAVLCGIYGSVGGKWLPLFPDSGNVSKIWKDIVGLTPSNPNLFNFCKVNVEITIGNGRIIMFWVDVWKGKASISSQSPRLN